MNLVPSDQFSYAELAELFTRGYEGYFVPMHFDEPTLRYMVDTWDIDLARSRVAPDAGLANLAIRGGRAWIGGIAVVPEQRRHGVGRALMEAVLELAPPTVLLEVIEANEPAIKLYESLGFEKTRVLEVWRVEAPEVPAETAVQSTLGQADLPWQREDASLPPDYERIEVDGGAMLFRGAHGVPARGTRRGCGGRAAVARHGAQLRERPGGRRRERCAGTLGRRAAAEAVRDGSSPLRSAPRC